MGKAVGRCGRSTLPFVSIVVDLAAPVPVLAAGGIADGRTLTNAFLDQWSGRESELAADHDARVAYRAGVVRGDMPPLPVWASESIDLITDLPRSPRKRLQAVGSGSCHRAAPCSNG